MGILLRFLLRTVKCNEKAEATGNLVCRTVKNRHKKRNPTRPLSVSF